ncbi:pyridoxal-phosphate dependent enzyme [Streptomyces sp. NPDC048290]|uniref:pyridoxal-phosphate dependent enzyme n=1 Tax=Streptomyces sp. NPDC048290 TaxID=3155811 RepID=UPI00344320A3
MAHEHGEKSPSVWARRAIDLLLADRACEPPTPLDRVPLPGRPGARVWLKDESRRPSGTAEHGPARDLLLDALREGRIDRDTPLFDTAGGGMALAQAYFARLLGLDCTAVLPAPPGPAEARAITRRGGRCRTAASPLAARELAERVGGHFLDHRHRLPDALDWSGPHSLGAEILAEVPSVAWIVMPDGDTTTGVGRHLRQSCRPGGAGPGARLAVVERPGAGARTAGEVADLTLPPAAAGLEGARRVLDHAGTDGPVVVVLAG